MANQGGDDNYTVNLDESLSELSSARPAMKSQRRKRAVVEDEDISQSVHTSKSAAAAIAPKKAQGGKRQRKVMFNESESVSMYKGGDDSSEWEDD